MNAGFPPEISSKDDSSAARSSLSEKGGASGLGGIEGLAQGQPVGLIAGNGQFPLAVARRLRELGAVPIVAAHIGETNPEIESLTPDCTWVRVGQLGKILRCFTRAGVRHVAMAGGISRVRIFGGSGARPDWQALKLIARLGTVRDDVLLRGIAEVLCQSGMKVFGAAQVLSNAVAEEGLLSRRNLDAGERQDARVGWEAAKAIGALDIGQTVVVYQGLVVAVEAVDGTDATIRRAGELTRRGDLGAPFSRSLSSGVSRALTSSLEFLAGAGGGNARGPVVVKLCKPQQDERLDLPTIGRTTIESMVAAGASALVIEAGKTLILDYDDVISQANAAGIVILASRGVP